jgi:TusA-related sulfurtransferase
MSSLSSQEQADDLLDLRGTPCPINFIRTKLRLEQMPPDSVLEVWLDAGEPIEQVPNSLKIEGYQLQSIKDCDSFFSLLVTRSPKL